ncbi:hypothetical protein [Streptomyces sp. TE33382]
MTGAHARPSRPDRAVLALAALALAPPAVVLTFKVATVVPPAASDTTSENQTGGHAARLPQHPDRDGARIPLTRRPAP